MSEHFTKFCACLHEILGFHGFNPSYFAICLNVGARKAEVLNSL